MSIRAPPTRSSCLRYDFFPPGGDRVMSPGSRRAGLALAAVALLFLLGVTPAMAGWTYEMVGSTYPWTPGEEVAGKVSGTITSHPFSLAVGSDNQSRISYLDPGQHLTFAGKDKNGFWSPVTVDDTVPAGANSLALTRKNVPGISYYDTQNRGLKYAFYFAQQGSWHTESVEGSLAGPYNSLVYTENGLPLVGYYSDGTKAEDQLQKFAQRDQNQWYRTTTERGSAGLFTVLALNATGSPVIGHYDGGSNRLKYVYRADAGDWRKDPWVADRVVDAGNTGRYLSLAIDRNNVLHFAYYNASGKSLKYAEGRTGGKDVVFKTVTVDSGNAGKYTSLALDREGNPHITYWDEQNQTLKYAVRDTSGTWTISGIRPWITGSTLDKVSSLAIGPDNIPRLCCIEHRLDGSTSLIYSELKPDAPPRPPSNLVGFGDPLMFTNGPSGTDYLMIGGSSAIRRNGTLEHFYGPLGTLNSAFRKYSWAEVTSGAGITTSGDLGTWYPWRMPPGSQNVITWQNATPDKKYLTVSQYFEHTIPSENDWRLVLYADGSGATHIEAQGNAALHPEVFRNIPTGTGWQMVAAGRDHALAVRSDGTLVAWGSNYYGQLDLPKDARYTDIAAGDDFSVGLAAVTSGSGTSGQIFTAGKNDYQQVSGGPKDADTYIAIAAGPYAAAALSHDGHIRTWGRNLAGVPAAGNFTDIVIGESFGIAIREPTAELHVTGPISPGKEVPNADGVDKALPDSIILWHTHNDVTRVFDTAGNQLLWANDQDARTAKFPTGARLPVNLIHYVKKGSVVNGTADYRAIVTSPGSDGPVMDIHENAWYEEGAGSLPRAMCFADVGCSAGVSAKQQLFLSDPVKPADGGIPVFSVRQDSDNSSIGTLSILGSTNAADTTSIQIEKKNYDPSHAINFSIISGNWGRDEGTNMYVTARANLTSTSPGALLYTITATASQNTSLMEITPQIWQKTQAGDLLVYTGHAVYCPNAITCVATGNFMSSADADYFANASVLYVVPEFLAGDGKVV